MSKNSFVDIRFPVDISFGAIGGPEFSNTVKTTKGNKEFRYCNSTLPRRSYTIGYNLRNIEQISTLVAFFYICSGKAKSFRYKDWIDYNATLSEIAIGDDICIDFQLCKKYTVGNQSFVRVISKPVVNTVSLFVDEKPLDQMEWKVDHLTGMVQLRNPLKQNSVLMASFEFDVEVRFDTDYMPISISDKDIYSVESIKLLEVLN